MTAAMLAAGALLSDAAAFALAVAALGIGGESNPVARELYALGGIDAILAVKVAQAIVAATLAYALARRPSRLARAAALLPAVVGLAGASTAVLALAGASIR